MARPTLVNSDLTGYSLAKLHQEVHRLSDRTGPRAIERRNEALGLIEERAYACRAILERRKFTSSAAAHEVTARYPLDYLVGEPTEFLVDSVRDHVSDLDNARSIDGLTWAAAERRYLQEIADVVAELAARAWTEAGR